MTDLLVFPVGHMVGTYHDDTDAEGHHHEVRRGGQIHELTDHELVAWMLAHGDPDGVNDEPWTDTHLVRNLHARQVPRPAPLVDGLLDRRLLVEFAPGTDTATDFARAHRVVPTMHGLGNSPTEPWLYSIGLIGQERIRVSRPVFEVWAWSHLDPSLWHGCETFAGLQKETGGDATAEVLEGFLATLHGLLGAQVAYIDTVERA